MLIACVYICFNSEHVGVVLSLLAADGNLLLQLFVVVLTVDYGWTDKWMDEWMNGWLVR